eukprot:CAMPEP_0177491522 /NCGR_PEP_ID=MMETSP0369-20130122/31870_1 /TAXON_ID=447022 ORGANISM="Scrippsiella hangoei-like, Strain SHHI-4" /NCGR_SAMPLE_ID=MMETSP0369 /ASSEMBLY_ACC=CAM_ASM_000364 /LENGTH=193 /DNA_ID=CAMNT_0018968235 /DNA_START=187 /DNA_END=766 /DNA_ORIENTATION=-
MSLIMVLKSKRKQDACKSRMALAENMYRAQRKQHRLPARKQLERFHEPLKLNLTVVTPRIAPSLKRCSHGIAELPGRSLTTPPLVPPPALVPQKYAEYARKSASCRAASTDSFTSIKSGSSEISTNMAAFKSYKGEVGPKVPNTRRMTSPSEGNWLSQAFIASSNATQLFRMTSLASTTEVTAARASGAPAQA